MKRGLATMLLNMKHDCFTTGAPGCGLREQSTFLPEDKLQYTSGQSAKHMIEHEELKH